MQQKPNPILHMLLWGFGSGTVLALLYIVFIGGLGSSSLGELLWFLVQPDAWRLGLLFGGFPGAVLGLITGFVLWFLSRGFQIPFSRAEMQVQRWRVYAVVGTLTTILGMILQTLVFGISSFLYLMPILLFPPLIAGIAAAYAAHRYMFRLWLWSEKQYKLEKEKVKNIERMIDHLHDKAKVDDMDFDDGKEEKIQKLS